MRLLVIEDEEALASALKRGLEKSGFTVDVAPDGPEGLAMAQINSYDLVLLDLNLPGMDGLEVLREIRGGDQAQRVLILTARSDYPHRIRGLDMGANDYLCKPFDFGELVARVRALLRRCFVQQQSEIPFAGFVFDMAGRRVTAASGQAVELSPKELAILEYLLLNRGRPATMEDLIEHVWPGDDSLFSNTVKVHMSTLRKKLAAHWDGPIITWARGRGYVLEEEQQV